MKNSFNTKKPHFNASFDNNAKQEQILRNEGNISSLTSVRIHGVFLN